MSLFKDKLNSTNELISIGDLLNKLQDLREDDKLDLDPIYQRAITWEQSKMSAYVHSIMMGIVSLNITITVNKNKCICLDGKQRLTSLLKFYQNELPIILEPVINNDDNDNNDSDDDSDNDVYRTQYIYYDKIPIKKDRNKEFDYIVLNVIDKKQFLETNIPITYYKGLSYDQQVSIFNRIQFSVSSTDGERTISLFKDEKIASKFKQFCCKHNYSGKSNMKNVNVLLNIMYMSHYGRLQVLSSLSEKKKFIDLLSDDKILTNLINKHDDNLCVYFSKDIMDHSSIKNLKVTVNFFTAMFYILTCKFKNLNDDQETIQSLICDTWKIWDIPTNLNRTKSSIDALQHLNDFFEDVRIAYENKDEPDKKKIKVVKKDKKSSKVNLKIK